MIDKAGTFWPLCVLFSQLLLLVHVVLNLPNEVKLCNKHDLFLEYLDQCMKVSTELRFTFCVHIQYNGDTPLLDYSKNPSTVTKNDFNQ